MTKREIVKAIAAKTGLTQAQAKEAVQETLNAMIEQLSRAGRLELRNFGVFEVRKRRARTARNPRSGEPVKVPARKVVVFKPGKLMEQNIRKKRRR